MKNIIDFKKLLIQEPEFQKYCMTAFLTSMLESEPELIATLYNFYQSGITEEELANFVKNAFRFNEGNNEE